MNSQVIIYEDAEGLKIVYPCDNNLTIEQVIEKDVPQGIEYSIIDKSTLPTDRIFRNGWKKSGSTVTEDLTKSREIAKNIIRAKRKPLLENLDVEYMKALETNNTNKINQVKNDKQVLRDYPEQANSINTIEGLKTWINTI